MSVMSLMAVLIVVVTVAAGIAAVVRVGTGVILSRDAGDYREQGDNQESLGRDSGG